MKSLKGRAGVVAKGITETENVMHVWTKTIHRCAEITETMDSIVSEEKPSSKHKELFAGKVITLSIICLLSHFFGYFQSFSCAFFNIYS